MYVKAALALALLPELLAARSIARRGVDCNFSTGANDGDSCDGFASSWGISVDDLKSLNPGIDCSKSLDSAKEYCVSGTATPDQPTTTSSSKPSEPTSDGHSPTQDGIAANCDKYYKVQGGDSCDVIEKASSISHAQFSKWNPAINSACSNLLADYYVCVHVPGATAPPPDDGHSPHQDGIAGNCDKYYKVKSGDSCDVIQKANSISHAQFSQWNPALNDKCTNLLLDYYYCVHVPGATNPDDGHSPHQDGIASNCDKYYKVKSGDQCDTIEKNNNISHDQFSKWNPAVNAKCSNLLLDYYYCVHVPGAQPPPSSGPQPQMPGTTKDCKKYHKTQSGKGCYDIEQQYHITFDQLRRWNPAINAQCSNLYADYYVCVGV